MNRRSIPIDRSSLMRHPGFKKLWLAHSISQFGSQLTILALPLTASVMLDASPFQMGLLIAAGTLPNLLFGLLAGAWVDRWPRRPVLIAADLARAGLLLSVPVSALTGVLRIELLYVVAFLSGLATLLFDLAAQATLPPLIGRESLTDGNSRLEASRSVATVTGPSLAGLITQVLSAPLALIGDAVSFLASAVLISRLQLPTIQSGSEHRTTRRSVWQEIGEGLRVVRGNEILIAILRTAALWSFSTSMVISVYILFVTRTLGLDAATLGLVLAMAGVGMLPGTALAGPLRRRFGVGPTLIGSGFLASSSTLFMVGAMWWAPVYLLAIGQFLFGLGPMVFAISSLSLRQSVTPDHLQGRVNATYRFVTSGASPLGALAGGILGSQFGVHMSIIVGAVGMVIAVTLSLFSPLSRVRELPGVESTLLNVIGQ